MRNIVTIIGTTIYILAGLAFMIFAWSILPAKSAEYAGEYTCADVQWAVANLNKVTIKLIKARMTKAQLAAAKACLTETITTVAKQEIKE